MGRRGAEEGGMQSAEEHQCIALVPDAGDGALLCSAWDAAAVLEMVPGDPFVTFPPALHTPSGGCWGCAGGLLVSVTPPKGELGMLGVRVRAG